jgi:hypothetical protein
VGDIEAIMALSIQIGARTDRERGKELVAVRRRLTNAMFALSSYGREYLEAQKIPEQTTRALLQGLAGYGVPSG